MLKLKKILRLLPSILFLMLMLFSQITLASQVNIAVAANFQQTLEKIVALYHNKEQRLQHKDKTKINIISASTGTLYAQIKQGAPFDIFLSADSRRPKILEQASLIIPHSRFTYAYGHLLLLGQANLNNLTKQRLVMANPKLAPYGLAAQQSLQHLNLWSSLQAKLIMANNVNQVFNLLKTGNVKSGLLAFSQAQHTLSNHKYCLMPDNLHQAIKQQAVLLKSAKNNPAAKDFYYFMRTKIVKNFINNQGYAKHLPHQLRRCR